MVKMNAKKLKLIVKGEKKPTFGTDPNDPWSVRAGITESEIGMLHDYLKSRGINPDFVSKDTKISHAKSHEFHKWKKDHMFDDPINYVSTTAAEKIKKIRAQREEVEIGEMKTLKLTPVEMRQKALNRSRRLTTVIKHNGLHKEEALDKKTPTVDELAKKYNVSKEEVEKELEKGIKVEMEHSSDKKVAREIALDHLGEKLDYYKKLIKFVEEPVDSKAPKYSTKLFGEGYDDHEEIAKELIRRHGMNITKNHLRALEDERDSRGALDHEAVMNKVRAMGAMTEAKTIQGTALDKFRQAAAERARKHADIEKEMKSRHATGKEDMKGAIGRLEKHLNKEDVFQDPQAATQTAFDMGTQADDREPIYSKRKEMSKSARMIKALYKKHKMVKEDLYDHEKEDKSVATYGKKPKVDKQEVYDDDAEAAMILKGGKTLTGQTRDTLEIDPVMRKANNNNN